MRSSSLCAVVGILICAFTPSRAAAEDWVLTRDTENNDGTIFRLSPRISTWIADIKRGSTDCLSPTPGPVLLDTPSDAATNAEGPTDVPLDGSSCERSTTLEFGLGLGIQTSFRAVGPLHATIGLDVIFSSPDRSVFEDQVIVAIPFGLLVTWFEWPLRPTLEFEVTPLLYLTDDARDYMFGGEVGFAWRVFDWGDVALSIGFHSAASITMGRMNLAISPRL